MKPVGVPRDASGDRILAIADSLVEPRQGADQAAEATSWISFELADKTFALPVSHVRGIHRVGHVTPLPRAPRAVRGLVNLRGRVIVLIDLAVQLGVGEIRVDAASRVLDAEFGRRRLGLLVQTGGSLIRVQSGEVEAPSDEPDEELAARIVGVVSKREQSVVLLDAERLLAESARGRDDDDS